VNCYTVEPIHNTIGVRKTPLCKPIFGQVLVTPDLGCRGRNAGYPAKDLCTALTRRQLTCEDARIETPVRTYAVHAGHTTTISKQRIFLVFLRHLRQEVCDDRTGSQSALSPANVVSRYTTSLGNFLSLNTMTKPPNILLTVVSVALDVCCPAPNFCT
jgi:hypothetical protein